MHSSGTRCAAIAIVALLGVGCGDSHGGTTGTPIPADRLDEELASAICDYLEHCPIANDDSIGARLVLFSSPSMSCAEAFLALQPEVGASLQRQLAAGTVVYDAAAAGACVAALRGTCIGPTSSQFQPAACADVLEGTRTVGQSCRESDECVGDAYCTLPTGTPACGACMPRVAIGAPCTSNGECARDGLPYGSTCVTGTTGMGRCVELRLASNVAAGAPCGRVSEVGNVLTIGTCAAGLYCSDPGLEDTGTCTQPVAVGGACESTDIPCVGNAICRPDATGRRSCQPITIRSTAGDTCDDAMYILCGPLERLVCVSGLCQSTGDGTAGSMCTGGDFTLPCNGGLYCNRMTMRCETQKADGAMCLSDRECASGDCDGSTCGGPVCG